MLKMWRKKTLRSGKQLFIHESPGQKGTVIGVHGLTGHHMQLGHFQKALEKQYRMITYDLRGRGKSSNSSLESGIDHHVQDLIELIEVLKVDRPILMGYSLGAYICLKVASLIDVEALILIDGAGEVDEGQKELIFPSLIRLKQSYLSRLDYINQIRRIYEKYGIRWSEHMNRMVNYEIEKSNNVWVHKSNHDIIKEDLLSLFHFDLEYSTEQIDCPVMLIQANGNLGKRPFYYEAQYNKLKKRLSQLEIVKTKENHLTIVFNKHPEIEWKLLNFLEQNKVKYVAPSVKHEK